MSKDTTVLVLGIIVALLPFLGFPGSWETAIFVVVGLSIVGLSILIRRDMAAGRHCEPFEKEEKNDTFVQSHAKREEKTEREESKDAEV